MKKKLRHQGLVMIQFDVLPRTHQMSESNDACADLSLPPSGRLTFQRVLLAAYYIIYILHRAARARKFSHLSLASADRRTDGRINKRWDGCETPPAAVAKLCMRLLHKEKRDEISGAVKVTRSRFRESKSNSHAFGNQWLPPQRMQPAPAPHISDSRQ